MRLWTTVPVREPSSRGVVLGFMLICYLMLLTAGRYKRYSLAYVFLLAYTHFHIKLTTFDTFNLHFKGSSPFGLHILSYLWARLWQKWRLFKLGFGSIQFLCWIITHSHHCLLVSLICFELFWGTPVRQTYFVCPYLDSLKENWLQCAFILKEKVVGIIFRVAWGVATLCICSPMLSPRK